VTKNALCLKDAPRTLYSLREGSVASKAKRAKVGKPQAAPVRTVHDSAATELIMAARLSKRLGVSDVTLWRWRHDCRLGFPKGRRINRRVYFPWHEVAAWLERQQQTA
jgi:predicted DNA-binding transcriptional regulator AlpA